MGVEILDEEELNIETNDGWNELPYEEKDPVFKASAAYGISSTDITNWNNKSEFSGNYNDLTNKPIIPTNSDFTLNGLSEKSYNNLTDKPSIPSKTSDLTNDSGFITNTVDNLLNYYKKQEVNNLLDEKADTEDIPDLTDYVKNTDYATSSKGGVIKVGGTGETFLGGSNQLVCLSKTYTQYQDMNQYGFISKGTLENVLNARIGDIDTILETLTTGTGV